MNAPKDEFHDPGQPDLQGALDKAIRDGAIPVARIPRVRAAVAAFARLMRRPATELPAHQGFVIQQMRRLRRKPTGLSAKTLSNTRSELVYLVKALLRRGSRSVISRTDEWERFRTALERGPAWWSLSRFAGFSSRQNVAPSHVNDAHVGRFSKALQHSGEVENPLGHTRRIIRVWNKLAVDHPDLKIAPLTLTPQQRNRWTLLETAFPESFHADVTKWFERLTSDDPFSSRPQRALRPSTIRTRRHQIFKAASALVLSGHPIEAVRSLADLVTVEAFQALLRYLLKRQGDKSTEALHGLAAGLLAIARHHVEVDKTTEARLTTIVKNLDVDVTGFRSKTRTRLAAFEDDRYVAALLHLPARIFAETKIARSPRRRKQLAELAIATEILTFAPMRVGNLVALRLGVTMQRVALNRERRWLITVAAEKVKSCRTHFRNSERQP